MLYKSVKNYISLEIKNVYTFPALVCFASFTGTMSRGENNIRPTYAHTVDNIEVFKRETFKVTILKLAYEKDSLIRI